MPRKSQRTPAGPDREPTPRGASARDARRAWLSRLKEDAVRQLPLHAAAAVRARLRVDVEHALRHHAPDDPAPEVQDILATLVEEACQQLNEVEHQAQRTERKLELVTLARWALATVLNRCPAYLVGDLGSNKRANMTQAIWADLRPILDKALSGTESGDDVRQQVEAHVVKWRSEHDRWWHLRPPSPQQVVKGIHTAKTVVEAVNNTPEFRQLADTVIQAVQTKLRQRRQAKEPPPSPS